MMQVPLVGPLVYVPMQYAAAWLLDLLLSDVPTRPSVAAAATQAQVRTGSHACACCSGQSNPTEKWSLRVLRALESLSIWCSLMQLLALQEQGDGVATAPPVLRWMQRHKGCRREY